MTKQEAQELMSIFESMSRASSAMNQYQSADKFNECHDSIGKDIRRLIQLVQECRPSTKLYTAVRSDGTQIDCEERKEAMRMYDCLPHIVEVYSHDSFGTCHTIAKRK